MFESHHGLVGNAVLSSGELSLVPISYAELGDGGPIGGWRGSVKRLQDILIALLLVGFFAVPMLLIAAAIRCSSPGPVLFRQRRIGYDNRPFELLKFRSMYCHPPERGRLRQTTRHDSRVTPVGAVLRCTSLDELPQLFNVLRGEMSIVGPRPHAPGTCAGDCPFELVTPFYSARHRVRPGITGLAQVRGLRGETETADKLLRRVDADLEYIANWSLWLDLAILMRTAISVLDMRNAY